MLYSLRKTLALRSWDWSANSDSGTLHLVAVTPRHLFETPTSSLPAISRGLGIAVEVFRTRCGYVSVFFEECVMPQGVIKKLIADKGFGFIAGDKGELFFHHSAVEGGAFETLEEGQTVEFTEGQGPKGPRAESVRVI